MGPVERARATLSSARVERSGRAERQTRSIRSALRSRGIDAGGSARVLDALSIAMAPRRESLTDHHDPAFLHPGRSVLVLLHDVRPLEVESLVLGALHESQEPTLRADPGAVGRALGPEVVDRLAGFPLPGAERIVERLVLLDRTSAVAVLAERLDHLRHLHLGAAIWREWEAVHEEVERAWLPFAHRVDARLSTRFEHWSRVFRRRQARARSGTVGEAPSTST